MWIEVKIDKLAPDRTDYKQYGTVYAPEELYVEVEIPDEEGTQEVVEYGMKTVLTERGMKILVSKLAQIADDANKDYLHGKLPK